MTTFICYNNNSHVMTIITTAKDLLQLIHLQQQTVRNVLHGMAKLYTNKVILFMFQGTFFCVF